MPRAKRRPRDTRRDAPIEPAPTEARALAAWFAEGVRDEVAALEKSGSSQRFEVLSGIMLSTEGPNQAIFRFTLADGNRLPEEANGRLKTETTEYEASVTSQEADTIHLRLRGVSPEQRHIPRAVLLIDDTALLRMLAEVLDRIAGGVNPAGPLSVVTFHPHQATVATVALPRSVVRGRIEPCQQQVLEQACGSSVTYVWGPPGTGKTFVIARLIAALLESGERVLIASHTNAAVDQALYEAIKRDARENGPLAAHPAVAAGQVVRIGGKPDRRIPDTVRLDKIVESRTESATQQIEQLEFEADHLRHQGVQAEAAIHEWDKLASAFERLRAAEQAVKDQEKLYEQALAHATNIKGIIQTRRIELQAAQQAWFFRAARTERDQRSLHQAEHDLGQTEDKLQVIRQSGQSAVHVLKEARTSVASCQSVCIKLPQRLTLQQQLEDVRAKLTQIEEEIRQLHDFLAQMEKTIISEARAVFCTLTKNYTAEALEGQAFDAVIIDEISMALPPLVFVAANRATRRVVLVGDFLQLPPIVRSDSEISNRRLARDVFELAGIVIDGKPNPRCPVLAKLDGQHRMVPKIADVARHLVYVGAGGLRDDPEVIGRERPRWLNALSEDPLLIVDTADLHCWSGKEPGTLSRFNFYSSAIAADLAALAARGCKRPEDGKPPPIGIITPFAAQRRLLTRLVDAMGLRPWVAAGTVHTFQGQQAELIIFDSVLDEPYWSARLCTPHRSEKVLRDLNVAVTRACESFVFVGSSEWLNQHAKEPSALGKLWAHLKRHARLVQASELLASDKINPMTLFPDGGLVWPPGSLDGKPALELLDDTTFYTRFAQDVSQASKSIFALAAYFGEYRWPRVEPLLKAALNRGIDVTIVTPPAEEASSPGYIRQVLNNLRRCGAVVATASGLHGKDVIIDERIVYTGSMNWASHRGRIEVIHRINAPAYAKRCLEFLQAKHLRRASVMSDGTPRTCPHCRQPTWIVNLRQQPEWDLQPLKIGCTNKECAEGYLVPIDQRAPFAQWPVCQVDSLTRYRRVRRGRGEMWQCPKHPKVCPTDRVVPGDPG